MRKTPETSDRSANETQEELDRLKTEHHLILPQQRTFECRCPLSRLFRLLHPQEQTFLAVSPKVRS